MSPWLDLTILCLCVFASGVYSGSETGLYSLSRARVDLEARSGNFGAKLVRSLLEKDSTILITILIGNNVVLEMATHRGQSLLRGAGLSADEGAFAITLILTPIVFFAGELLPKDLFRQKPHTLLGFTAPWIVLSRFVFWPLERLLYGLSRVLERVFGVGPSALARLRGHEALLMLFEESAREGDLHSHAGELAKNVLRLRQIPVSRVMTRWERVLTVSAGSDEDAVVDALSGSPHSRLPVVEIGADGVSRPTSYLHQLAVLGRGDGVDPWSLSRPLIVVPPDASVDRALSKLRATGHRIALVGATNEAGGLEGEALGVVSLKDLVEEISGDLAGW